MRRACLIVNPTAGRARVFEQRRAALLEVLAVEGWAGECVMTSAHADSATELAAEAARRCELVIACGGDGTVHGVLQGVVRSGTCLGVLPFGTANALARNLGLPMEPVPAMRRLLQYPVREISLGVAEAHDRCRWFAVMAGAGPDGRLVHEMKLAAKAQLGRAAYYMEAARLFARRRFPAFVVRYRRVGAAVWESREAVAMMASRVPDLGGLFGGLTRESRLHHPHLLVQLLTGPARLSLPAWLALGRAGLGARNPWLTTVEVEELVCKPVSGEEVYAQADGEVVGVIPLSLRIEPAAVRMLMP